MTAQPDHESMPTADQRIAAAVRALATARGVRTIELAPVLGLGNSRIFAKVKGEAAWKASEIEAAANFFGVTTGDLFDGLGLFDNEKRPRRTGEASHGAPSGTRTPDPLIKSQLL